MKMTCDELEQLDEATIDSHCRSVDESKELQYKYKQNLVKNEANRFVGLLNIHSIRDFTK
jgi:hypothetical protein